MVAPEFNRQPRNDSRIITCYGNLFSKKERNPLEHSKPSLKDIVLKGECYLSLKIKGDYKFMKIMHFSKNGQFYLWLEEQKLVRIRKFEAMVALSKELDKQSLLKAVRSFEQINKKLK